MAVRPWRSLLPENRSLSHAHGGLGAGRVQSHHRNMCYRTVTMNLALGLRTLLLLAFVAAATVVLLHPGGGASSDAAANAMLIMARN